MVGIVRTVLTPRQELILRKVIEGYLEAGQPVGSKNLAASGELVWGPSTIRNELAILEELGLLAHPHTSAGRVPTESGYRLFVDRLLRERGDLDVQPLPLSLMRREVDEAMRAITEALSQMTDLLAIVTAPPVHTATIRHVEVLELQPQMLMVVIITSTGGVSKRLFAFEAPVDPGLIKWVGSYLNEQLSGLGLGARRLAQRLAEPGLGETERRFLERLRPAFSELADTTEDALYFDGAARLLSEHRSGELPQIDELMELLERRRALLGVLREALDEREPYVRIGAENDAPALRGLVLVAANYGLAHRNLGTVSVIGPTRMDYATAIRSVRGAAHELSRFVEEVYAPS